MAFAAHSPSITIYSKWRGETYEFSVPKSSVLLDMGHPRGRVWVCCLLGARGGGSTDPSLAASVPSAALLHCGAKEAGAQRRQALICTAQPHPLQGSGLRPLGSSPSLAVSSEREGRSESANEPELAVTMQAHPRLGRDR